MFAAILLHLSFRHRTCCGRKTRRTGAEEFPLPRRGCFASQGILGVNDILFRKEHIAHYYQHRQDIDNPMGFFAAPIDEL